MKLRAVTALVLSLVATTSMGERAIAATRALLPTEKAMVSQAISSHLIDPTGVLINWAPLKVPSSGTGAGYCVQANAKNRLGGYAGATTVVVFANWDGKKFSSIKDVLIDQSSAGQQLLAETCRGMGY